MANRNLFWAMRAALNHILGYLEPNHKSRYLNQYSIDSTRRWYHDSTGFGH